MILKNYIILMGCMPNGIFPRSVTKTKVTSLTAPEKELWPRDVFFLIIFVMMLVGMAALSVHSTGLGDPYRYINGSDSWGNVCGRKFNSKISGANVSGMDHSERRFEFHMGLSNIETALNPISYLLSSTKPARICVSECPTTIMDCTKLLEQNGYHNLSDITIARHVCTMHFGLILPHTTLLNRCIPSQLIQIAAASSGATVSEREGDNDTTDQQENQNSTDLEMGSLESYAASAAKHILTSLVKYKSDIIYMIIGSFILCLLVIVNLQIFTRVFLIASMVFGAFGCLLVTGYLWYNYAVVKGYVTEEELVNAFDSIAPAGQSVLDFIENKTREAESIRNQTLGINVPGAPSIGGAVPGAIPGAILEDALGAPGIQDIYGNVSTVNISNLFNNLAFDSIKQSQYLLPWAILATIFTVILLLIFVSVRSSLTLVVKIFDESTLAVMQMPLLMIEPIKTLVAMASICVYFIVVGAFIITIHMPEVDDRGFVRFVEREGTSISGLFCAHLFGSLWLIEFLSGCQQMILAGAVSRWFFSREEKRKEVDEEDGLQCEVKLSPTFQSTVELVLFGLGTVALGSMIIAIVQFARIVIGYMQSKLRGNESKMAKDISKALVCCLLCFEKVLKFINRNAYICAAMYGTSFFQSGKKAFKLIIDNAQHALALNCVGKFCHFLGKLCVVTLSALTAVLYFKLYRLGGDALLSEYLVALITVSIASYLIAHCFFTVYETTADTIFLCFCDDQDRNNGEDRPYYSSMRLQKLMKGGPNKKKSTIHAVTPQIAPEESARSAPKDWLDIPYRDRIVKLQGLPRPRGARGRRIREIQRSYAPGFWIENEVDEKRLNSCDGRGDIRATGEGMAVSRPILKRKCDLCCSPCHPTRTPTPFPDLRTPAPSISKHTVAPKPVSLPGQILELDELFDLIIADSTDTSTTVPSSSTSEEAKKKFEFSVADTVEDRKEGDGEGERSTKTLDENIKESSEDERTNKIETPSETENGENIKIFKEAKICNNKKHSNENPSNDNTLIVIDLEDVIEVAGDDVTDIHKNAPAEQHDVIDPKNVILSPICFDQLA